MYILFPLMFALFRDIYQIENEHSVQIGNIVQMRHHSCFFFLCVFLDFEWSKEAIDLCFLTFFFYGVCILSRKIFEMLRFFHAGCVLNEKFCLRTFY